MVGVLDERFFLGSAKSFGKNLDNYYRILTKSEKVFRQKWKIDINYYSEIRIELQPFLRKNVQQINILEVGVWNEGNPWKFEGHIGVM